MAAALGKNQGSQLMKTLPIVTVLGLSLVSLPAWETPPPTPVVQAYSGRATVVSASGLINATVVDTGPLPSAGGAIDADLLDLSVLGLLTAQLGEADTVGQTNNSDSSACVANLSLSIDLISIGADALCAYAHADCTRVSGHSDIAGLTVNGIPITVTGAPNQTLQLLVGTLTINEQVLGNDSITVNALHLKINGLEDVIIGHAEADVTCVTGTIARTTEGRRFR